MWLKHRCRIYLARYTPDALGQPVVVFSNVGCLRPIWRSQLL